MKGSENAYRDILATSVSIAHLSLSLLRYSIAARSLAVTTPSFSEALAFQIRTFPSSEPDNTNRASPEYTVDVTLYSTLSDRDLVKYLTLTHLCMRFVWYTSGLCAAFPSLNCQILTVLSHPPLTNSIPVGLQSQLVTALEWALYICVGRLRYLTSNVYKLWSSDARRRSVGSVGDQDRDVDWKCMTTRRSALEVRIS